MKNPIKRNRNIGTAKQGHGKCNKLVIPWPAAVEKDFYERIESYTKIKRTINGNEFTLVIEKTRNEIIHACSVNDVFQMVSYICREDYGELKLIVLRQPKRKEELLCPVWGRLVYSYEFEGDYLPALIIESINTKKRYKRSKKMSIHDKREFNNLIDDGHNFTETKRNYEAAYNLGNIRNTQLYRTLPHEFGHYVHYLEIVIRPLKSIKDELDKLDKITDDEDSDNFDLMMEEWERVFERYHKLLDRNSDAYFKIPQVEKEMFADKYAEKLQNELKSKGLIPFAQLEGI